MDNIETSGSALATGSIAARFITQNAVDEAKDRREQEWKEAYARIGQEPPPEVVEAPHDGRTLFERLEEQKNLKQEEWDNKMKLGNQYRGLQADEYEFLSEKMRETAEKEREVAERDNAELQSYREALAKRQTADMVASDPQIGRPVKRVPVKQPKKDMKALMKGIVVKKKSGSAGKGAKPGAGDSGSSAGKGAKRGTGDDQPGEKKRKV